MKQIPSDSDWRSVPWCIDMPYAYDHFFGKTLPEAVSLLDDNSIVYSEDFLFMPPLCLDFYLDAYIDYLLSGFSLDDFEGASSFLSLIELRSDDIRSFSPFTIDRVRIVLRKLGADPMRYDTDTDFIGGFPARSEKALSLLS